MECFELRVLSDQLIKSDNLYYTQSNQSDVIAIIDNDEDLMWAARHSLTGERILQQIVRIDFIDHFMIIESKHQDDHTVKIQRKLPISNIFIEKYSKHN
ncbi:hypothetical protein A9D46_00450 [Photobacterium damselae subsp. damselae]|uniref:hypothetical protein n=1 Tax=Photobacterium damselae TaxID=38293 RepID=UPI00084AD501|nr:hypothetical protein [Photobacterium damselae]OEC84056.1 hypothetical protein A9D46_00450 [Photobacterium damselae subsp. damselae]